MNELLLTSGRWAAVGTESVSDDYSMLIGTALFLVKIKFKFHHALVGGHTSKTVLCDITFLTGCTPKFTCIFL